ncbi:carbohydrate kinase family protein [Mesorhizobium sp. BAC0120]|uniref:carbohydrate kinase family protein n=1 Tax=Mesorhizobium sp. BAC0120 TaxID=3090670 RepID=UPI00298C711A|nr:carbohydrate kinase family protein [Mesorhizobium sp. BAC0120]MDW6022561.1 carbohydrate kinase family protein [Mesorhizobium sp. BAC0120]
MTGDVNGETALPEIHLIGGVIVDLIMGRVAPWPQPGTETFVPHSELRAGGPAGNTALALKALGVPHHVICNIGNDMFGAWLTATFGEAAQRWNKVRRPTAISVAIEHPGGERSFFTEPGHLAAQEVGEILDMLPVKAVPGSIALLTGAFLHPDLLDSFAGLLQAIGRRGFTVALDTGWPPHGWDEATREKVSSWLAWCDHILFNEIESRSLSGAASVEAAARWMRERAKPDAVLVIKRGAEGASAWIGGEIVHARAPAVQVVDTTGAGDAFNAGYLGACLRGAPVAVALAEGVEVASAAIASSPREYRPPRSRTVAAASQASSTAD